MSDSANLHIRVTISRGWRSGRLEIGNSVAALIEEEKAHDRTSMDWEALQAEDVALR